MDGFTASPATGPTPPTHRNPLLLLLRLLPWPLFRQVQGAALPINPSCDGSSHGQPWTRLYTSGMTRLSRPQRLLLQLAVLATLLMVLAPLVSRALHAQPMDHAAMAGMDHAHMQHDGAVAGQSPLPAHTDPTPPADPHAMHGEACEYCVLAMRLLPWLAVLVLLLPLLWRPRLVFPWSRQVLPALCWPAHAARGPPPFSIVR